MAILNPKNRAANQIQPDLEGFIDRSIGIHLRGWLHDNIYRTVAEAVGWSIRVPVVGGLREELWQS